jgi:hypothetical protein
LVVSLYGTAYALLAPYFSFWLVDALLHIGRHEDARELFERVITRANDLGLLKLIPYGRIGEPEEVGPPLHHVHSKIMRPFLFSGNLPEGIEPMARVKLPARQSREDQ